MNPGPPAFFDITKPSANGIVSGTALTASALTIQVGGDHYKGKAIQPVEYIHANKLGFIEGSVVKYITRWREKNGFEDLKKIKHYVDLLIELETKKIESSRKGESADQSVTG